MKVELKLLQAAFNTTFVYITHDQSEALVMSDNIAVMNHGRFEQIGTPYEVYHAPTSAFVAGFVGEANMIGGTVAALNGGALTLTSDTGAAMKIEAPVTGLDVGQRAQVFLRPEAIELVTTGDGVNVSSGVVDSVLFNGANSSITVQDQSGSLLKVALPQTGAFASLRKGDTVFTRWDPAQARCYPAAAT